MHTTAADSETAVRERLKTAIDLRSDTVTKPSPEMRRLCLKPRSATMSTAKTQP